MCLMVPCPCRYQAQHPSSRKSWRGYDTRSLWQMRLYRIVRWCLPVTGKHIIVVISVLPTT